MPVSAWVQQRCSCGQLTAAPRWGRTAGSGSPPMQQNRHTKTCLFQIVDQAPCSRRQDEICTGHPCWRLARVEFCSAMLVSS